MNIFDAHTHKLLKQIYLENEYYAISSNNIDKIAVGGKDNQVDIHDLF